MVAVKSKPHVKRASLGGSGNDSSFEQTFADMAHNAVREKAPMLMDYELGFQVLDRDSTDDSRGMGIVGFKAGEQVMYVPVFFINGEVKGTELLWLKNQDVMVPLKEEWINRILHRRQDIKNELVPRNPTSLGLRQPMLHPQSMMAGAKFASTIRPELLPGVAAFAKMALNPPSWPDTDLRNFVKHAGIEVARQLAQWCHDRPKIMVELSKHYDIPALLKEAYDTHYGVMSPTRPPVNRSVLDIPPQQIVKRGAVAVLGSASDDITREERAKLVRDGMIVHDTRLDNEVAIPYRLNIDKNITNPAATGIYNVLLSPGRFARCAVFLKPYTHRGRKEMATVVALDEKDSAGNPEYLNAPINKIWINQSERHGEPYTHYSAEETATVTALEDEQQGPDRKDTSTVPSLENEESGHDLDLDLGEYEKWFETLPKADELPTGESGRYMLVRRSGSSTAPFRVRSFTSLAGRDDTLYNVWFDDYCPDDRSPHWRPSRSHRPTRNYYDDDHYNDHYDEAMEYIQMSPLQLGDLRADGRYLVAPVGCRLLELERTPENMPTYEDESDSKKSKKLPFRLGNKVDIRELIFNKTAALEVANLGSEFRINDIGKLNKNAAIVQLMTKHDLREADAREILDDVKRGTAKTYRLLKNAYAEYDLLKSAPNAPQIPEQQYSGSGDLSQLAQTDQPQQYELPVDQYREPPKRMDSLEVPQQQSQPDQQAIQRLMQQSQSGDKDLLDASALNGLMRGSHDDVMIDQFVPKARAALDAYGRMLFSSYQHGDEWQERFGKADMPAIQDSLRNLFEDTGDLILELETKQIDTVPGQESFVNIDHAAS